MVIDLNESQIHSLARIRAILDGTHAVDSHLRQARTSAPIGSVGVVRRLCYRQLTRPHRGLQYIRRFRGFSRAQITRLVQRWALGQKLKCAKGAPANAFSRRYTDSDLQALAEAEREYGRLAGPAMVAVLRRMYQVYGDERSCACSTFRRRTSITCRSAAYRAHHTVYTKTRTDPKGAAIAV